MLSLKFKSRALKDNLDKIILGVFALIAVLFLRWSAVPVLFVGYLIVSLILKPGRDKPAA
jgi:CDP-diacylglycerol--serine O-phosphatidyltransferase